MVEEGESSKARKECVCAGLHRVIQISKMKEKDSRTSDHHEVDDNKLLVRTPWLVATKWLERFSGQNMDNLIALAEKPKPMDMVLTMVWNEVLSMFKECHIGLKDMRKQRWPRGEETRDSPRFVSLVTSGSGLETRDTSYEANEDDTPKTRDERVHLTSMTNESNILLKIFVTRSPRLVYSCGNFRSAPHDPLHFAGFKVRFP